jgi:hypothetical protein
MKRCVANGVPMNSFCSGAFSYWARRVDSAGKSTVSCPEELYFADRPEFDVAAGLAPFASKEYR